MSNEQPTDQSKDASKKPKVGVYLCHCGKNISDVVDIPALMQSTKDNPVVTVVKEYKFMCSNAGQELIAEDIRKNNIDRVVVAACSPLMHEETYRRVLKEEGVNEFFFEQANIREHVSWVNLHDKEGE